MSFSEPVLLLLTGVAVLAQVRTYSQLGAGASPRVARLQREVRSGDRGAVDRFWKEIRKHGAPLVERDSGDNSLVTFVWHGEPETHNVVIFDGVAGFDAKDRMEHLEGTNVWYKTYRVRNDARFAYNLSPNDSLQPLDEIKGDGIEKRLADFQIDPLNPRRCGATFGAFSAAASYVELPGAPPQAWKKAAASQRGKVEASTFHSTILNNERDLWIYTPHGFSTNRGRYPLVVLFDGTRNVKWIPEILDYLIAEKQIPPVVAAFVASPSSAARNLELPCHEPFADFLAKELVPMLRLKYSATSDPARTVAVGSSYGGLAAVFAGMRYPQIFGNVISLSGSFWWKLGSQKAPEWLTTQLADSPKLALRFYLEVGLMESYPMQIAANRHMRDVLKGRGYTVGYEEYNGGHAFLNWSSGTANGLVFLLGDGKRQELKGR